MSQAKIEQAFALVAKDAGRLRDMPNAAIAENMPLIRELVEHALTLYVRGILEQARQDNGTE